MFRYFLGENKHAIRRKRTDIVLLDSELVDGGDI